MEKRLLMSTNTSNTIYKNEIRIYKPRKNKDGAATKLQMKIVPEQYGDKVFIFWVSTLQKPKNDENNNAAFAWGDKQKEVTLKLEAVDLSQILTTLKGITKETKLFHQNATGNSTLTITKYNDNFNIRVSKKVGTTVSEVKHSLTPGETEILKIVFADAISTIYGW